MMEETSLQKGNFDEYFYGVTYESSPGALRRAAAEAYLTISVPTATNGIAAVSRVEGLGEHGQLIYYAFATSDGSAYLACGSWDEEALSDPASDDSEFLWVARLAKVKQVVEWFDHYRDDNAARDVVDTAITLEEFPAVTFSREPGSISAESGGKASTLLAGAPVWNAFFADLTGDGLPEICSTAGFALGGVDDFVVIYDYANGVSYSLTDRGNYSYSLSLQEDKLMVKKSSVASGETVGEGYLAYIGGTLTIISGEDAETSSSSPGLSSASGDYIAAHKSEFAELIGYDDQTLQYCFSQFLQNLLNHGAILDGLSGHDLLVHGLQLDAVAVGQLLEPCAVAAQGLLARHRMAERVMVVAGLSGIAAVTPVYGYLSLHATIHPAFQIEGYFGKVVRCFGRFRDLPLFTTSKVAFFRVFSKEGTAGN